MRLIGNILWIIFGGLFLSILWIISGIILCITIVGIPFGVQCFKFGSLVLAPFGSRVVYGGGIGSLFFNILWIIFFGWELALSSLLLGILWCITIVGLPWGLQCFKFAKLSLMPFGAKIL